uniref:hypothetical protein n=1 Tax=Frankia sp. CiP3 TaxID=2880971 RepID=UPI001EF7464C|nr:hypothetical protein [Frankia sp. CiP3]
MVNQDGWATRRLAGLLAATGVVTMIAGVLLGRYAFPAPDATATQPRGAEPVGRMQPSAEASSTVVARPSEGSGTGTSPPQAPTQTGRQLPGMPTRINEFGIPVGYPHTEAGAISACGNYVSAIQDPSMRSGGGIHLIFKSIALESSIEPLSKKIINSNAEIEKKFSISSINDPKFGFSLRVVGYKTIFNKNDEVAVSIWSTSSIGVYGDNNSGLSPQEKWGTDICKVSWSSEDWKLSEATDGPSTPPITSREAEAIQRFTYIGRPTT